MYYSANIMVFVRGDQFIVFLKSLSEMRKEQLRNYETVVHYTDKLASTVYYSTALVTCAGVLESFVKQSYCNEKEFLNEKHYVCGCLLPLWFPFEINIPHFQPLCALYVFGFYLAQIPAMASSVSLYLGSVEFILLKIEKLKEELKKVDFENSNKEKVNTQFMFCVKYYMEISSLVQEMNDCVGYIFAPTHNANNNLMIGILGYLAMKLTSIPNVLQLIIWIFVQWISCYSGQKLENASSSLRNEVNELPWYDMDTSLARIYKIFHSCVDSTFHMKIQPIMYMNMNNFSSILKGAYSFFMCLLKM
ncbi:uncharacterized protein LOC123313145 [Coccinella septempunctata]|uniref:uncharacterized protein LOC123313145 n=1 Tax=Coccinella septempunctata TaxID=41139 RepID=UPI001D061499|nr:uncharacterized protein LOC123313145 [Coccinella septempunctata]